jgi:DNA-binding MarR family transcriptional regulator
MPDRRPKRPHRTNTPQASHRARPAERPPLDIGVLEEHLGYFIRRLQVWVFQDFIRTLESIDLSPAQYSVLVVTAANAGASQSRIGSTLGIERARLVRLLDRLEKRGLLERLPSPDDGRSHALRLTRDGNKTLKRAKALAAGHEAKLTEILGAEQRKVLMDSLRNSAL